MQKMNEVIELVRALNEKIDYVSTVLNDIKHHFSISEPDGRHCKHEYLKTSRLADRGCMVRCKNMAHHGLPYCGVHYWRYLNDPDVHAGIQQLAFCNGYTNLISKKYNLVMQKPVKSERDNAIIRIHQLLQHMRTTQTPSPLNTHSYSAPSITDTPLINTQNIKLYGHVTHDLRDMCSTASSKYATQLEYIKNMPTKDFMKSVYVFDFLAYLDGPTTVYTNVFKLDASIRRFKSEYIYSDKTVRYNTNNSDSPLLFGLESISKVENSIIEAPLSDDAISMLFDQTVKYKTPNIGLILNVHNERYAEHAHVRTIHNYLGMYNRIHLDILRSRMNDIERHGDIHINEKLVSKSVKYFSSKMSSITNDIIPGFTGFSVLKYDKHGFLYDPYTAYIYYPTEFGTVCIGVAFVEKVTESTEDHKNGEITERQYTSSMTVHVAMLNRFEIMRCISNNQNYLDSYTGSVCYYNKLIDGVVMYNANYYTGGEFVPQVLPPSPVNLNLQIPMDLFTTIDACSVCADGDKSPLNLNPTLVIKRSTGTGVPKIDQTMEDYDQYTNALQYLSVPNVFYCTGQLRRNDEWVACRAHTVSMLSNHDFRFNEALCSTTSTQIENYTARNCMVSVCGRACVSMLDEIINEIIPETSHVLAVDQRDLGIIIDPLTKYVITIKGCTNICIGVVCRTNKIQDIDDRGVISVKRHWRLYYLTDGEISVCKHRNMNYLEPRSGRVVYYSYCDHRINRIVYNLNYYNNPTGPIIPCYQPPRYC